MLYAFFLIFALLYNVRKFRRERATFIASLSEATSLSHQVMILTHFFHIYIFESFLALVVAHLISEGNLSLSMAAMAVLYAALLALGLLVYQFFLRYVEKETALELRPAFNQHVVKEIRVSFALIMLPIMLYSLINWTFQDSVYEEWGNLWFIGLPANILFVSVLTISVTVVIMLRLIPNREITEPEYLAVIDKHLKRIGQPSMRVRWIETDMKNAFVVGMRLLRFSNQTVFIGRSLRTTLNIEEFEAIIAHELAHVANRHIHKRVIELLKNFILGFTGFMLCGPTLYLLLYLVMGEDLDLHYSSAIILCTIVSMSWFFFNYALFFDTIRSHEFEADAYAVIELGVPFQAFRSALEKLTKATDLPTYLQSKQVRKSSKGVAGWFRRTFSTHPSLDQRFSSLQHKLRHRLPYNYYISPAQKIRASLSNIFRPQVLAPVFGVMMVYAGWVAHTFQTGKWMVKQVREAEVEALMQNRSLVESIDRRPYIVGRSLMYYVVQRRDPQLIRHFVDQGANAGRTLIYLAEIKDLKLFQEYFGKLERKISLDEYLLVLQKAADVKFTEGYRYLVNSPKFDQLDTTSKTDLAGINRSIQKRQPASTIKDR